MADYQPGSCNINPAESQKRFIAGLLGFLTGTGLSLAYIWGSAPLYILVLAFLAFGSGALGMLQARKNFCVKYAHQGTQKTGQTVTAVNSDAQAQQDRLTANKLSLQALLSALALTALAYGAGKIGQLLF